MEILKLQRPIDMPANFTGILELENVGKIWFKNGIKHREDGPAVEYLSGTKEWFINGLSHREDSPAKEYSGGSKEWHYEGKFHRVDGPTRIGDDNLGNSWALDDKLLFNTLIHRMNTNHPIKLSMDLRNKLVLSKIEHPKYPTVKIWKILDHERISELIVIPGMEEYVTQ
jgi:hypothetical protein